MSFVIGSALHYPNDSLIKYGLKRRLSLSRYGFYCKGYIYNTLESTTSNRKNGKTSKHSIGLVFLTQNHKVGISSNGLRDQSHEATLSILYLSPIISGEEFKK